MSDPLRVLFVHGAGGRGWEWNVWRGVFDAHGVDTSAPDLQPSPRGLEATRFEDYRTQVVEAARTMSSSAPLALIGASLGGLLALAAADAVGASALVLVNPLPPAPLHERLPRREWPALVPWRRDATLAGTRRAMSGADAAACLYAFRRWRDESGAVMAEAAAGVVAAVSARVLVIAARDDGDVPAPVSLALARQLGADHVSCDGGHLDPLLGRDAAQAALLALHWLLARGGRRATGLTADSSSAA